MDSFFWEFGGIQGHLDKIIPPLPENGLATVNKDSRVVASVTEIEVPPGSVIGSPNNIPFIGEANDMMIKNIAPLDPTPGIPGGRVHIIIDTNWSGGPINIRINFVVFP